MKTFNLKSFLLMIAVLFSFLYFHIPTDYSQATASACPWPVFTPINITSNNLLINPGFEEGPQENPIGWTGYHYGYTIDPDGGRDGGRALQLTNTEGNTHGAFQIVHLNQTEPQPLYFSGWSKADNITGFSDSDYSLYIDVLYSDGNSLWGQVLLFDTSSQDWQFREGVIIPKKPIESVNFYCLLRASHSGTAWFDDVKVQTIESGIILDSVPIEANPPSPAVYGSESLSLETTDGLSLNLSTEGGAILGIKLNDTQIGDPNFSFASGFFIKDAANNSSFIHVGGSLEQDTEKITHNGIIPELNMEFRAIYRAASDHINIHAEMTNTSNSEEALTLYFALPINATEDWQWGDDIRRNRSISSTNEFINASTEYSGIGASGILSKYPWACLSGPAGGIAMGIPLDKPSIMRLIYNPAVHQFYAAFDLGLSSNTTKFPNRAWADLIIYPFDGEWGFRAAAKGYYERFPDAFIRRIPPNREGIWVAFTDLSSINNVEDFTIAFHETGNLDLVPFDQDNGILPFYYLSEPQTHWLSVNDSTVNLDDYDQVIAHLQGQYGLPNLLKNDRFEEGTQEDADGWMSYGSGYTIDPEGGRDGGQALQITNTAGNAHGAMQIVFLNRQRPRPLYYSGWSKAEGITGSPDMDYSLYLDAYYIDGNALYGNVLPFNTGSHEWELREGFIIPKRPVQTVNIHCLLRNTHSGKAWFDCLNLHEVILFPNLLTNPGFENVNPCSGWTCNGLCCQMDETVAQSGTQSLKLINEQSSDAQVAYQYIVINQTEPRPLYFSGWSKAGGITGYPDSNYSFYLDIQYMDGTPSYGHVIRFNTGTHDWEFQEGFIMPEKPVQSVNVHCLLRNTHSGTAWFDDLSVQEVVPVLPNQLANAGFEDANICSDWIYYSPGSSVDGNISRSSDRSLKLTNESPSDAQFAFQTIMINQIKPSPLYFSGWSKAENVSGEPDNNYSIYLDIFFTDGTPSYGHVIRFNTGTHDWEFGEGFIMPEKPIRSIKGYCLLRLSHTGTVWFDDLSVRTAGRESHRAEATLSSGLYDQRGRYRYYTFGPCEMPWCRGGVGCSSFILNPDPDITDPDYALNKAHLDWNADIREEIENKLEPNGGLYVDSFLRDAFLMDFRTAHFAAADIPLSYRTIDRKVGVPEVFATIEFIRWVAQDTRDELGMKMMANWILRDLPWGADLFDVMGTETNWMSEAGDFVAENDTTLSYRRTLSFQRPYCLLMNTDFDQLTHEWVEQYFRICLFYGIYPSMFSHNAADKPYWEDPNLYNSDRDLFKRYIPIILSLNTFGWQPVTYAATNNSYIYIERFGSWPNLYFTLRNMTEYEKNISISLYANELGLPYGPLTSHALFSDTLHPVVNAISPKRYVYLTLSPLAVEILSIQQIKAVNIHLSSGLTFFGCPVKLPKGYTSYDLIAELGTEDEILRIQRYDPNTNGYETTAYDPNGTPFGDEFTIVHGEGYIVYMTVDKSIAFSGPVMNPVISLNEGPNMISIQNASPGYSSYDLLSYLGSPDDIASIGRFDSETGIFETTSYYYGRPSGDEFEIINGDAYLIHMKAARDYKDGPLGIALYNEQ